MTQLEQAEKLISELTTSEKARLLQRVVRKLDHLDDWFPYFPYFPYFLGIETSDDVCGGEPRIVRTRIPVWLLEQARRLGTSEADLLRSYPTLRAEDLVAAWHYADLHKDSIDEQIRQNEEA